jgi:hypothetical protein
MKLTPLPPAAPVSVARATGATLLLASLVLASSACRHEPKPGESIDAVCKVENDDKEVTVSGYFRGPKLLSFCGTSCQMRLVDRMTSKDDDDVKSVTINVPVGSGNNAMKEPPKKFTEKDLEVNDKSGGKVRAGSVVRVTGKALVSDLGGHLSCQISSISRIEKL